MRWPTWLGGSGDSSNEEPPRKQTKPPISWDDSLNRIDWRHYTEPRTWIPMALVAVTAVVAVQLHITYLRRIPGPDHILPSFFRKRSLLGRVTSVGDGDGFHLYHTPGGRPAGWGWIRRVPKDKKVLKGQTIPIRIAGIDAPEGAHFGRPAQPFSGEALTFLTSYILGRSVRAHIYRRDQYDRVVGTVWVRRWLLFRKDVGLEMLKRGLATTYEAKTNVEFGGREAVYKAAEAKAKAKRLGLWSGKAAEFESPREYKTRMKGAEVPPAVNK